MHGSYGTDEWITFREREVVEIFPKSPNARVGNFAVSRAGGGDF